MLAAFPMRSRFSFSRFAAVNPLTSRERSNILPWHSADIYYARAPTFRVSDGASRSGFGVSNGSTFFPANGSGLGDPVRIRRFPLFCVRSLHKDSLDLLLAWPAQVTPAHYIC
jgi:hypothetical protein